MLVTGGSSGLGAAVAAAVEAEGGTPVVLDLRPPPNGFAFGRSTSPTPARRRGGGARGRRGAGGLDAVVTAAGTDACGDILDVDADAWDRVVAVNLLGTAAVVRAALPALERSRGRVVTVASTLGLRALPAATAYCASKFGVVGFTRALAERARRPRRRDAAGPGRHADALLRRPPGGVQAGGRPAPQRPGGRRAHASSSRCASPPGCELRELLVTPAGEPSWP